MNKQIAESGSLTILKPAKKTVKLNEHTSVSLFRGNDGVNELLSAGGVSSSAELVKFVGRHLLGGYKQVPPRSCLVVLYSIQLPTILI